MHLPGRLRATTLGDLLGTLHRADANGTLELIEDRGRSHRIHLASGLVIAVEFDGAASSLAELLRRERAVDDDTLRRSLLRALSSSRLHGDVLVRDFRVSPLVLGSALRRQITARLAMLEQLADARVHFRVAVRPPRSALVDAPLEPREFLAGRRRARERGEPRVEARNSHAHARGAAPASMPRHDPRAVAFRILGVLPSADSTEIKRAFRQRARELHPDMHPDVSEAERRALESRFAEVTAAYHALVA
jgi:DnaJ-domain-containing protein 1